MVKKRRKPSKNRKNKNGLTPNQQIFADEWLIDRNGTRAYLVAYPAVKKAHTAQTASSRLLLNVVIKAYIDKRLEAMSASAKIDQEWVLERFRRLVDYKITDYFDDDGVMLPLSKIPEEAIFAIMGYEVDTKFGILAGEESADILKSFIQKFKLPNKVDSLKALARYLGMFEKDNKQKNPVDALASLLAKIAGQSKRELEA